MWRIGTSQTVRERHPDLHMETEKGLDVVFMDLSFGRYELIDANN